MKNNFRWLYCEHTFTNTLIFSSLNINLHNGIFLIDTFCVQMACGYTSHAYKNQKPPTFIGICKYDTNWQINVHFRTSVNITLTGSLQILANIILLAL